jgi:sec-independent protein translocase protein TatA
MGIGELVLVLLIVVLFFGASRLPALGQGLGKAVRGVKDALGSSDRPPHDEPPPRELPRPPEGGPGGA